MQKKITFFLLLITFSLFSQGSQLADSYFRKGEYEKAIQLYEPLHRANRVRRDYIKKLLTSYQQLEKFNEANNLLQGQLIDFPNQTYLNVEIGYNYQLQDDLKEAEYYYKKSLDLIKVNPGFAFVIGRVFQQNHLLDYALQSYQIARSINPKLNTEISEAQIYGEKGDLEKMFNLYLDLIDKNEQYYPTIQRYTASFVTEDKNNSTNIIFKKLILKRLQSNPKDSWNILLSWLYMKQKDFDKALVQEKSLYKRNPKNLERIIEVGMVSFNKKDLVTAQNSFLFIIENSLDEKVKLQSQVYLLKIDEEEALSKNELESVDKKFQVLIEQYGKTNASIELQTAYANFLSYNLNQSEKGIKLLEEIIPLASSNFQKANILISLADILVFSNQFNQALILYSRVQSNMKNSTNAQEARFKVAQTSYFKGDFKWAQTQLKVLKSSTSQLIANDALELNLLISNNIANDSIQDALKLYAKADLLAHQKKYEQAIDTLDSVLVKFKGHAIEDDALFKQAKLYIKTDKFEKAEKNFLSIVQNYPESILIDDSYFLLAKMYENNLNNNDLAKEMYEKIIFEYPSSIYLVEARKRFRLLRGDDIQ
jgi:tetratricopeptide (TPR) repeat protein